MGKKGIALTVAVLFYLPTLLLEIGKRFLGGFVETWKGRKAICQTYPVLHYAVTGEADQVFEDATGRPVAYSKLSVAHKLTTGMRDTLTFEVINREQVPAFLNRLVREGHSEILIFNPDGETVYRI